MIRDAFAEVDEESWRIARRRAKCVRGLLNQPSLSSTAVDEAASREGVTRNTVYRWIRKFREGGERTSALLDLPRGAARGTCRLPGDVEAIMAETIAELCRQPERPRPSAIIRVVRERCARVGLMSPGGNTVRRRLRSHGDPLTQELSGRRLADPRARRPVRGAFPATSQPLEVVQIDHTLADVIIVDSERRQPIGRPWVTFAIDVTSRVIAGFHLALDPPSTTSAALCLAHVMTPKEDWLEKRGLDMDWPVFGRPLRIHLDNAREFHSRALKAGCEEHGIEIVHRPPGAPHYGGHIERLIGTMMGDLHLLPGTTHSDVRERGSGDPGARARLTLAELERWMALAIDVYHQRLHRGIGTAPIVRWTGLLETADARANRRLAAPDDPARILIDFLPLEERRVTREGVRLFNIAYWSDALRPIAGTPKRRLVRYDPRDLSQIWLRAPNGDYLPLPYRQRHRQPISLWEHREARRQLREEGKRRIDEALIFERVAQMQAIVDAAAGAAKSARRKQARREAAHEKPPRVIDGRAVSPATPSRDSRVRLSSPPKLFDVEDW